MGRRYKNPSAGPVSDPWTSLLCQDADWLCLHNTQSILLPQIVKRSISSKSFLGLLGACPSPSCPVLIMIIFSSSSSGVVRNVSESLLGAAETPLSATVAAWVLSGNPPPSVVGSAQRQWGMIHEVLENLQASFIMCSYWYYSLTAPYLSVLRE